MSNVKNLRNMFGNQVPIRTRPVVSSHGRLPDDAPADDVEQKIKSPKPAGAQQLFGFDVRKSTLERKKEEISQKSANANAPKKTPPPTYSKPVKPTTNGHVKSPTSPPATKTPAVQQKTKTSPRDQTITLKSGKTIKLSDLPSNLVISNDEIYEKEHMEEALESDVSQRIPARPPTVCLSKISLAEAGSGGSGTSGSTTNGSTNRLSARISRFADDVQGTYDDVGQTAKRRSARPESGVQSMCSDDVQATYDDIKTTPKRNTQMEENDDIGIYDDATTTN